VHGIEISVDMVAQLKTKPGAGRVSVTVGDFATAKVDGAFIGGPGGGSPLSRTVSVALG
jgi:hypothetical protein